MKDSELYTRITLYRAQLNRLGSIRGLSDPLVVALSKRLDKLILTAMKRGERGNVG
jgi:hypothetical protein